MSILDAVASGDRREALIALRDHLAARLDHPDVSDRDAAALALRLQSVIDDLDGAIVPTSAGSVSDALAARRAARQAASG